MPTPLEQRYRWLPNAGSTGRYRDRATGRFVSELNVRGDLDKYIDAKNSVLDDLANQLRNREISLADWQLQMRAEIRNMHNAAAMVAKGGRNQMTFADWGRVGQRLRFQYGKLDDWAADIASGKAKVVGRNPDNSVKVVYTEARAKLPTTQWDFPSHNAEHHGTAVLKSLLPSRRFPFPKSLYAVEDAIRFFVADKPDAVILDFFAGSGTTAHAVMRLNRQDSGSRQAIIVTNNEVSADEAKSLTERGFRDGDAEWEALGIFEHITRPRITAAVTGLTPDGTAIKGDYKFTDEFPMAEGLDENVEFMKLTYLDPVDVELDRAFAAVAPMLWLRAGGQGSTVAERTDAGGDLLPFAVADRYGVLFDPDRWRDFVAALPADARTVFVVTDSAAVFAGVAESLPADLAVVRLYENYLTTFAINQGRAS